VLPLLHQHQRTDLICNRGRCTVLQQLHALRSAGDNGSSCAGPGTEDKDAASVRADTPVPPDCGVYYFEVTVINPGRECFIGARPAAAQRRALHRCLDVPAECVPQCCRGLKHRALTRALCSDHLCPGARGRSDGALARRRHWVCHVGGADGPAPRLGQPQLRLPRRRRLRVQRLRQGQRVRADVQHGCASVRAWTPSCRPAPLRKLPHSRQTPARPLPPRGRARAPRTRPTRCSGGGAARRRRDRRAVQPRGALHQLPEERHRPGRRVRRRAARGAPVPVRRHAHAGGGGAASAAPA